MKLTIEATSITGLAQQIRAILSEIESTAAPVAAAPVAAAPVAAAPVAAAPVAAAPVAAAPVAAAPVAAAPVAAAPVAAAPVAAAPVAAAPVAAAPVAAAPVAAAPVADVDKLNGELVRLYNIDGNRTRIDELLIKHNGKGSIAGISVENLNAALIEVAALVAQ